jgi:glycosyltransferase involved in cell wall biosynthesis
MRFIRALVKAVSAFWTALSKSELEQVFIPTLKDLEVARGSEHAPLPRSSFHLSELPAIIHDKLVYHLAGSDNDYSNYEKHFRYGSVRLVDFLAHHREDLTPKAAAAYDAAKRTIVYSFLNTEYRVPTLSIVVPVGLGRGSEVLACLSSIKWQNLVQSRPSRVELLIVQDGDSSDPTQNAITPALIDLIRSFPRETGRRIFKLTGSGFLWGTGLESRRSTARNVGIVKARNRIIFFIDSSIVLSPDFLTEQMLRHERVRHGHIALLGFKEKIDEAEYERDVDLIRTGKRFPKYWYDWKWSHVLKEDEAPLEFDKRYEPRQEIRYMEITDNLKHLRWGINIGYRSAPTFFHTGITSVPLSCVREVGGFDPEFNPLWGFEDSFLGAQLLATGVKIVPCPSSVAFQLKHTDSPYKAEQIRVQRSLYNERLDEDMHRFNFDVLKKGIDDLEDSRALKEIEWR